ncbi:VanZ family protein [Paenibacillus tianjinensis]|uniref:VanZ family protein n=1 Tax=Paenibacillus tianjinensis TaxID=2810347 RepID=A0ABX7LGZ2_9BACL|nr:VanZ family protein [Paenibacillus tianjinensis]QSF47347.1 VanZ family protein [Paenibacillus tianjinensis]
MKAVMLFLLGIVLLIFTCAANSTFWSTGVLPYFHWTPSPDYHHLLVMDLYHTKAYIIRKIGHFSGFCIFGILLYRITRSYGKSIFWSIIFAVTTEIFQLYFGRDGRLYDMVIDSAGILTGMILLGLMKSWPRTSGLISRRS